MLRRNNNALEGGLDLDSDTYDDYDDDDTDDDIYDWKMSLLIVINISY